MKLNLRLLRLLFLVLLAFFTVSCTTLTVPLNTVVDPQHRFAKSAKFALLPEPDMRLDRRLLYGRMETYLPRAGLTVVTPENADYFIRVIMPPGGPADTNIGFATKVEFSVNVRFLVYRSGDVKMRRLESVWEGAVLVLDQDWREYEEQIVTSVFQHVGEKFDGKISVTTKKS